MELDQNDSWKGSQRSFQWQAERVHAFFQTWQLTRGLVVVKGGHAWCELMFRYVRREEWSARRGQETPLFSFFFCEGSPSTANPVVSSTVLLLLHLAGGTEEWKATEGNGGNSCQGAGSQLVESLEPQHEVAAQHKKTTQKRKTSSRLPIMSSE